MKNEYLLILCILMSMGFCILFGFMVGRDGFYMDIKTVCIKVNKQVDLIDGGVSDINDRLIIIEEKLKDK